MEKIINIILRRYKETFESKSFKANETIFYEHDKCDHIGIVKNGEISIKSYFADGKEVTYNTLKTGQMFGNNLIFSSRPFYRGDVIAEKDSEIIFISKETLIDLLMNDQEFLMAYLSEQSDFSKTLNFKIKLLTISGAEDRFVYYLTFNNNKISFKSVTKLANELYMTRESLSRTIKKLKDSGRILVDQKTITLMVEK